MEKKKKNSRGDKKTGLFVVKSCNPISPRSFGDLVGCTLHFFFKYRKAKKKKKKKNTRLDDIDPVDSLSQF